MRRCTIPNCKLGKNSSLFGLSRHSKLREKWLHAIFSAYPKLSKKKHILICEKHFRLEDFTYVLTDSDGKIVQEAAPQLRKRLKRTAVPHFGSSPSHQVLSTINKTSDSPQSLTHSRVENKPKPSTSGVSSSHNVTHVKPQESTPPPPTKTGRTISNENCPIISKNRTISNYKSKPKHSIYKSSSYPKTHDNLLHMFAYAKWSACPDPSLGKTNPICEKHLQPTDSSDDDEEIIESISQKSANSTPLDPITEILVSPTLPFMQIRRIRGEEAHTIVGQAINVPVDDNAMVTTIPHHSDDDQALDVNINDSESHGDSHTSDTSRSMAVSKTAPITENITDSTRVFIDETGEIIQNSTMKEQCLEPKRNINGSTNCTHVLIDESGEIIQQFEKDLDNHSKWKMNNCQEGLKEVVHPKFFNFQLDSPKPIFVHCDESGTSLVKEEESYDPLAMEGELVIKTEDQLSSVYSGDSIGIKSESVEVKEEVTDDFG